ncbi:MAG TPA: TonB-dependent receptor [Bryobacteraceae bacterium]|nr:TonB-dependent receptor [Bryobacteraceae bacterium]
MKVQFENRRALGLLMVFACGGSLSHSLFAAEAATESSAGIAAEAAVAAPAAPRAGGSLIGVTLAPGGFSLAAVNVIIRGLAGSTPRQLVSDAEGTFAIEDLAPGTYQITASKEGFATPTVTTVEVATNRTTNASVQLTQGVSGSLRGVTLAPDGFSLPGAKVGIQNVAGTFDHSTVTDSGGTFMMKDLPPGSYLITASKDGFTNPPALIVAVAQNRTSNANVQFALAKPVEVAEAKAADVAPAKPVEIAQAPPAGGQSALPPKTVDPTPAATTPPPVDLQTPFAYADYTWLNGTSRNKDVAIDTPFFTPEIRFDTHFMTDFNQPIDHTIVGATESFRSGEFQVEQASVGGDFHWQNVRGRIFFMQGLFATTTPRNDATPDVGQWDLRDAYKYVSEAYGGYHFNVNHGLNVDAGIFVSYIGLFSYYNFDNWTYQPSYVSSNTPWFFNGLRIQWFPTNKLKIEPWIINGWQSYARANGHHGFGGQILWRPKEWLSMVFNNYGNGTDAVGAPNRVRIHTDDSIEIRYYNKPESNGVSKMALSFTGDLGCEYGAGGGTSCTGKGGQPKQAFLGWMEYNRIWFHKDLVALTLGGGMMENPGRYLTLLPPIDGANAFTGTPYFPESPGLNAHQWDSTVTLQYMPREYITWWGEVGYRHSDVPYFAGRGGVTPPGGNNGVPSQYACMSGAPSGATDLATAYTNCGGPGTVWFPDLRRSEVKLSVGVMVKF